MEKSRAGTTTDQVEVFTPDSPINFRYLQAPSSSMCVESPSTMMRFLNIIGVR